MSDGRTSIPVEPMSNATWQTLLAVAAKHPQGVNLAYLESLTGSARPTVQRALLDLAGFGYVTTWFEDRSRFGRATEAGLIAVRQRQPPSRHHLKRKDKVATAPAPARTGRAVLAPQRVRIVDDPDPITRIRDLIRNGEAGIARTICRTMGWTFPQDEADRVAAASAAATEAPPTDTSTVSAPVPFQGPAPEPAPVPAPARTIPGTGFSSPSNQASG